MDGALYTKASLPSPTITPMLIVQHQIVPCQPRPDYSSPSCGTFSGLGTYMYKKSIGPCGPYSTDGRGCKLEHLV